MQNERSVVSSASNCIRFYTSARHFRLVRTRTNMHTEAQRAQDVNQPESSSHARLKCARRPYIASCARHEADTYAAYQHHTLSAASFACSSNDTRKANADMLASTCSATNTSLRTTCNGLQPNRQICASYPLHVYKA
jgi:hypothetical protein